ncbi:hypothetical protein MMC21_007382 [Puttea exsequens]|nr:hypothetical protein [Puttea exsequens]
MASTCEVLVCAGIGENDTVIGIYYLDSILSVTSAANVANAYATAMNQLLCNLHQPLNEIDLFTPRDLDQVRRWNQYLPPRVNSCVHDLVLQHARTSPQTPALRSWDGDLTYEQLNTSTLRLAKYLVNLGIQCETLVPVCFTKSIYAVIAMVATHRAGGAFIPLDPSHPKDRINAIIEKAKAKLVIADPETADRFEGSDLAVLRVSAALLETLQPDTGPPLPEVRADNAAFVLFTSGSTGKPKGIVQEHASVCTSSLAHGRAMNFTSKSRVFQYAAFTFDVSMMDIFTTLICGGCVCIPSEEDRMGDFTAAMNRMHVNWVLFTPSVASLIKSEEVPTLETLALGGEAVKEENLCRWSGKVTLFNCYGPAECGACAVGEFGQKGLRPANIGRQFGGGLNWVVDPENHDRLQPIGVVGELVVEGPTLARGYLDDLPKTQAAFIKSPAWSRQAGPTGPRRVYKTGDLVRQNSDGTFEFVGRKDHQLKVRGQRVELGEVEFHLAKYPGIILSTVARPLTGPYSQALVGIIQLQYRSANIMRKPAGLEYVSKKELSTMRFDKEALFKFLKSQLPSYMVPQHFLIVKSLPLSVSGKIDRKVLENWLLNTTRQTESERTSDTIPKTNFIALEMCSKILSMIAQPDTKFHDSLDGSNFPLATVALDSIQMITLTMFIRQRFGVKIHLETLMHPSATVQSITNVIEKLQLGYQGQTMEPKQSIMDIFAVYKEQAFMSFQNAKSGARNIFVTGATGFLGSRILHNLCADISVSRVVVHVRSQNSEHAIHRIVHSAQKARWWTDDYLSKIEPWVGDLAKPRLGLNSDQWSRLRGDGNPTQRITAVIHNGATINWNATFASLKATNVDSTVALLNAASGSAALTDFVYVSGGQQLRVQVDNDVEIAEEVMQFNGYAQTKFLSELIVKEYAKSAASNQQRVSVVKPGYIIGTTKDGVAPTDDFIWRLAASCIDARAYNAKDAGSWLFVSDVDRVASAVNEACSFDTVRQLPIKSAQIIKVLDGIPMLDFFSLLESVLGCDLQPLTSEAWMTRIYADIANKGERHCLWPLLQTVEQCKGLIGAPCDPRGSVAFDERRVRTAVKKNIEYLSDIGFLRTPTDGRTISVVKSDLGFVEPALVSVQPVLFH